MPRSCPTIDRSAGQCPLRRRGRRQSGQHADHLHPMRCAHRMATSKAPPPEDYTERIGDIEVDQDMLEAFLEYAYSAIRSRALPDARYGLKPVQRRILFQMAEMGLRPDPGHVKSSHVVDDVMGRLHPHGDDAIY